MLALVRRQEQRWPTLAGRAWLTRQQQHPPRSPSARHAEAQAAPFNEGAEVLEDNALIRRGPLLGGW
jgi:hypothetical protein